MTKADGQSFIIGEDGDMSHDSAERGEVPTVPQDPSANTTTTMMPDLTDTITTDATRRDDGKEERQPVVTISPHKVASIKNKSDNRTTSSALPDFKAQVRYAPGEASRQQGGPMQLKKQNTKGSGDDGDPDFKHQVQSVVRQQQQDNNNDSSSSAATSSQPRQTAGNAAGSTGAANTSSTPGAFRIEPPGRQTSRSSSSSSSSSSSLDDIDHEVPVQRATVGAAAEDALSADVVPECKCFCRCERYKVLWGLSILATFLVALAVFLGAFCGTGNCGSGSSNGTSVDNADNVETPPPTLKRRDPAVASAVADYINSITLSETDIEYPFDAAVSSPTPEELALQWLIESDSLQLTVDTEASRFRLVQRFALVTLYFASNGHTWTDTTGWFDANECRWFGITCDSNFSRETVTKVALKSNNLSGHTPEDIALLSSLTVLDLQDNSIAGTIPENILLLTVLAALNLSTNLISGTINSELGINLSGLTYLDFGNNQLFGTVPASIGKLVGLGTLGLWQNSFTGPLFENIEQLSNLRTIWADNNDFSGSLPESLGKWTAMTEFAINNNALTGSLPKSLGQWTGLTDFRINDNEFGGSLPESVGQWASLKRFWVHNNAFVAALPDSIGQMVSLEEFSAFNNSFNATIPDAIGNWENIQEVRLYENSLTGTMPTSVCSVASLVTLDVDCAEVECSCCKKDGVKICD